MIIYLLIYDRMVTFWVQTAGNWTPWFCRDFPHFFKNLPWFCRFFLWFEYIPSNRSWIKRRKPSNIEPTKNDSFSPSRPPLLHKSVYNFWKLSANWPKLKFRYHRLTLIPTFDISQHLKTRLRSGPWHQRICLRQVWDKSETWVGKRARWNRPQQKGVYVGRGRRRRGDRLWTYRLCDASSELSEEFPRPAIVAAFVDGVYLSVDGFGRDWEKRPSMRFALCLCQLLLLLQLNRKHEMSRNVIRR